MKSSAKSSATTRLQGNRSMKPKHRNISVLLRNVSSFTSHGVEQGFLKVSLVSTECARHVECWDSPPVSHLQVSDLATAVAVQPTFTR